MAHVTVNARRVRPVRLDSHEGKAVLADEPLGDGGAGTIEFRGPVGGFSDEHNARICEAVEEQGELVRLALDTLATAFERS